jgi:heme A synthase
VVLSGLHPIVNTAHVVNGALLLGTALVLALRVHRPAALDVRQTTDVKATARRPIDPLGLGEVRH